MWRVKGPAGGMLLALGALALVEALRIRDEWPGARLVPAVVGLALVGVGVAHLVGPGAGRPAWPDAAGWRRVAVVFGVLTTGRCTAARPRRSS